MPPSRLWPLCYKSFKRTHSPDVFPWTPERARSLAQLAPDRFARAVRDASFIASGTLVYEEQTEGRSIRGPGTHFIRIANMTYHRGSIGPLDEARIAGCDRRLGHCNFVISYVSNPERKNECEVGERSHVLTLYAPGRSDKRKNVKRQQ